MAVDIVTLNAIVLHWFAIVFIPNAIRDKQSGRYIGYLNAQVLKLALVLPGIETVLVLTKFGLNVMSFARIGFNTAYPFALALAWLALTQKKLYGNNFPMKEDKH